MRIPSSTKRAGTGLSCRMYEINHPKRSQSPGLRIQALLGPWTGPVSPGLMIA